MSWAKCAEDNYHCFLERLSTKGEQMLTERPLTRKTAPVVHPQRKWAEYQPFDPFRRDAPL